jgi:signal transduction histidine kinase
MFYDMSAQKQTMQALQSSEARTRALLEAIPDLIFEVASDGTYLKSTQPSSTSLYIVPEQFIGRKITEVMPDSVARPTLSAIQRVIATGKLELFEYQLPMPDGVHDYEARVVASGTDSVLSIVRDITQRKWIETEREKFIAELEAQNRESETLRESLASIVGTFEFEEIVRRILEQIRNVIPYDTASVWMYANDKQTFIAGVDLPPGVVDPGTALIADERNSAYPILQGKVPYVLSNNVQEELTDFQPPHDYIHSWLALPLKTRGKVTGLIALDGRSKNQFTLHHAELGVAFANQVAIALDNARLFLDLQEQLKKQIALRSASVSISSSLHLDEVLNEICRQMCNINSGTSAYIAQYNSGHDFYAIVAEFVEGDASASEKISDLGVKYYKKDGAWMFEENGNVESMLMYSDDTDLSSWSKNVMTTYGGNSILYVPLYVQGRLLGHAELWDSRRHREFSQDEILFCHTLSQQAAVAIANANLFEQLQKELAANKDLIDELEAKNSELERFTYTVSHDLKSPLFTIRGFLGYLEEDALNGNQARLKADMQRISDATEKMQMLLNDLLELSRIGRLKNDSVSIPFEELAQEAVELVQGQIMDRGVAVRINPDLPVVFGDRPRLLEVLQNLIDNAAKFMGSQKHPRIEIGQMGMDGDKPVLFVRDNGIGIAPEHFERVFGLFNKLDAKTDGTGIGLSLVKRIIEVHGGRVWVESEPGTGSTFYFTLPLQPVGS